MQTIAGYETRTVDARGLRFSYLEWGAAASPPMVLLHGLTGPIKVQKRHYTGDMPALGEALNDEQIAAVLTYIRREWGHGAGAVEPARVAAERAATAGHVGAWSAEELRARNMEPAPRD